MKKFAAKVLIEPKDVSAMVAALSAVGCTYAKDEDARDPAGIYDFGMVVGESELPENELGDWLDVVLRGIGADIDSWHYGPPWKIPD